MKTGTKVNGTYCGEFKFSGTVTESRPVTVKTDGCILHLIELDNPITIYGTQRSRIQVGTLYDGSPSSYNKYQDSMEVQK